MRDDNIPYHMRDDVSFTESHPPSYDQTSNTSQSSIEAIALARAQEMKQSKLDIDDTTSINFADFRSTGPGLDSRASLDEEGIINIWVDLKRPLPDLPEGYAPSIREYAVDPLGGQDCPPLNIVIFIVGSRGDIQPYLALALQLIISRGHRVRIATHPDFHDMIVSANVRLAGLTDQRGLPLTGHLEFFNVGGDPRELMAYMVKNPGLLPGLASLTNGDIESKRKMTKTLLKGFYRSCFSPNESTGRQFAADAIISNPPAFAHIHIAEALGLPLLMSFTMPWTPTTQFAHPLVNVQTSNAEPGMTNFLSYALADTLMWQGLGDVINSFRAKTLNLPPLSMRTGPLVTDRLKIPVTYAWSSSLLPKPRDWKENIDIVGFFSLPSEKRYSPEPSLAEFLVAGEPPIYIGFGSIVVKDPDNLTTIIIEAVKKTRVRAVISAGWSDLGGHDLPEEVFLIKGDVPHDWLFGEGRIAAVCHHGGAGTTSAALRAGLPNIIIPFFGDQKFWGEAIADTRAGPDPIPYKDLTTDNLAQAIIFVLTDQARRAASAIGRQIRSENGEQRGTESFHKHLPLLNMRCQVNPNRVALWWSQELCLRLSGAAAAVLVEERLLSWRSLEPHRPVEHDTGRHYNDPFTAGASAILNLITHSFASTAQFFYAPHKSIVNLMWGVPKTSFDVVGSIQEGFENVPGMLGSRVRRRGRVTSFKTGLNEGAKGMAWGLIDGFTGLVTDPYDGAKAGGVPGFVGGFMKSYVNLVARPTAGALGMIVHPASGAFRGARSRFSGIGMASSEPLRDARERASHEDAKALSANERAAILGDFKVYTRSDLVKARRVAEEERLDQAEAELLADTEHPERNPKAPLGGGSSKVGGSSTIGRSTGNSGDTTPGLATSRSRRNRMLRENSSGSSSTSSGARAGPGPSTLSRGNTSPTTPPYWTDKDPRWLAMSDAITSPGSTLLPGPPGLTEWASSAAAGRRRTSPPGYEEVESQQEEGGPAPGWQPRAATRHLARLKMDYLPSDASSFAGASTIDLAFAGTSDRWAERSSASTSTMGDNDEEPEEPEEEEPKEADDQEGNDNEAKDGDERGSNVKGNDDENKEETDTDNDEDEGFSGQSFKRRVSTSATIRSIPASVKGKERAHDD